ncbi:MAG: hypothetical protein PF482_20940 [Desulfobacteraceae bacterium]|nr:hypothetical protein [Desulfobacteraceae bacterium]
METAIYALSELSKKQAPQLSKINTGLSTGILPWNIAIAIDATIQNWTNLHTENSNRFNHGKGFVVGHQWINIILI